MKKGDELELTIESIAFGGNGLAKLDGFAVFVRNAIPGEKVRARVVKSRSRFAEAIMLERLTESTFHAQPECPHFDHCGGCRFQHLDYERQLAEKEQQVKDLLERMGGFEDVAPDTIIPAPDIYYYRNKMEFSFSNRRWLIGDEDLEPADFALGLHVPGNYLKVLDIEDCRLQSPVSNRILRSVRESAREFGLDPFDSKTHTGYLRYLIVRQAFNTSDLLVNVVTKSDDPGELDGLVKKLLVDVPEVTTVVNVVNESKASTAFGDVINVLHGDGSFRERFGDVEIEIGPQDFMQTNTLQGAAMYEKILEYADLKKGETIFDLFCGVGSISLFIAPHVEKVIGFELMPDAVECAARNAVANGLFNCLFYSGDMKELMRDTDAVKKRFGNPDVIILDPPRAGVHPGIPKRLGRLKPSRIVYASCNPATMARDLKLICEFGYKLKKVQPFDMFPHTPHIEVVVLLVRE